MIIENAAITKVNKREMSWLSNNLKVEFYLMQYVKLNPTCRRDVMSL